MSRSPVEGEGSRGPRSLTSKKVILTAVLMVAVLAVTCFVVVNDSEDSRYGNIGPVKRDDIIGRVWFRFKTDDKKAKIIF